MFGQSREYDSDCYDVEESHRRARKTGEAVDARADTSLKRCFQHKV
jgi:hypothetical protein